ncbi:MAG: hypothetical protein A2V67_13725 [Deltaproteobacteria bacterium RBG_13_61_14]|nr:MAG: hypothetical protein A2V67_13725 [Deltaproteobacteria bacterium RBG_13_61_14]
MNSWARSACLGVLAVLYLTGCMKGPNPWSPKTYPGELGRYERDPADLPASWKKFYVEGEEEKYFFFENEALRASITVSFTCGKYTDIPLEILAEHLLFPMGRSAVVESKGYVPGGRVEVYHLRARGQVEYGEPEKDQAHGPAAERVMDAYTVGENHCVVDVSYLAPADAFAQGLPDFQAALRDYGIPMAEENVGRR